MGKTETNKVMAGGYGLEDSALFRQLGEQRAGQNQSRILPEIRFGRAVNTHVATRFAWYEHQDFIGSQNYGKGKAMAYGGMTLTHVNAKEASLMFADKYPQPFNDKNSRRVLSIFRGIAREYGCFVGQQDLNSSEVYHALRQDGYDEEAEQSYRQWGMASFSVAPQPEHFSKNDWSVVFVKSDEELLRDEMEQTWRFLHDAGFKTRYIDRNRRPHLTKFETFQPIGTVALRSISQPDLIDLMQPHAFVNDNMLVNR
jgi:hypothetical protein